MGSIRKIVYASVSSPGNAKTVFSSAQTRGELFAEVPELELLSKGMKAWVKDADNSNDQGYGLSSGDSRLPEGNVALYFLVDKNDSGTSVEIIKEVEESIEEWLDEHFGAVNSNEAPF